MGAGASGLKHAATECSGERSDLNKGAVGPRWLMRERWGVRQGQRLPTECLIERVLTSLRIRTPLGDAQDQYQLEIAGITECVSRKTARSGNRRNSFLLILSIENFSLWPHFWNLSN